MGFGCPYVKKPPTFIDERDHALQLVLAGRTEIDTRSVTL